MMEKSQIVDLYTCRHDFNNANKDSHGRVLPDLNAQHLFDPIVSNYLYKHGFKPEYPDGKKFAVCVSHDVDRLFEPQWTYKTLLNQQTRALLKLDLKALQENPKNRKRRIYPRHHLNNTLAIGDKYGVKSSFYFLSLQINEQDFNYDVSEITPLFNELKNAQHEIGLHGGHKAFNNQEKIKEELSNLEKYSPTKVVGYRSHYLKMEMPKTWSHLEANNFLYDTTYGLAQQIGFRNGLCYPFLASTETGELSKLAVLPLQVMDETLFSYMKLKTSEAYKRCIHLFEIVAKLNGVVTLLWHNNYMFGERGEFYDALLKYLHSQNAWFTTGENLIHHFQRNNYFEEQKNILSLA